MISIGLTNQRIEHIYCQTFIIICFNSAHYEACKDPCAEIFLYATISHQRGSAKELVGTGKLAKIYAGSFQRREIIGQADKRL